VRIVTGFEHVCRRKGCGHSEAATNAAPRRCPQHKMKLWVKPQVRPIRFHDLRHTTGSLLFQSGANPAAVQRILRHSDPRITTEVYGHLAPDYLKAEVDRLRFGAAPPMSPPAEPEAQVTAAVVNAEPFAALVLQESKIDDPTDRSAPPQAAQSLSLLAARPAGLEPATRGLEVRGRRSKK
jgi:integrase